MKIAELKNKSKEELGVILKSSRDNLRELRFRVSQRELKNVREVRKTKKLIARVMTLLKIKENS